MSRPLAVITGASSGIGAVFARKLAPTHDLLLVARRRDRMEQLAAGFGSSPTEVLEADLADPSGLDRVAERVASADLLVNNAGFGTKGLFHQAALDDQVRMHRLHVDAVLRLTHAALPGMVARDSGAVINVSSVAGFLRGPGSVSYCATKSWINAFTEGLYLEMRSIGSRVNVQALCPGYTRSEFHQTMGVERSTIPSWLWMDADTVVDASLRGLRAGKLFVVPGWKYRVLTSVLSKVPTAMRLAAEQRSPQKRHRM